MSVVHAILVVFVLLIVMSSRPLFGRGLLGLLIWISAVLASTYYAVHVIRSGPAGAPAS